MGTTPDITAAIAIGSNLGDRMTHLAGALIAVASLPQTRVLGRGPVVQTAALAPPGEEADAASAGAAGEAYLNSVVVVATKLTPPKLLDELHRIERQFGRDRTREPRRWMPRTLDLDLLIYGDAQIDSPNLTVPHPRMKERWFVLAPLAAVWPEAAVPGTGKTVRELLAEVEAKSGGVR